MDANVGIWSIRFKAADAHLDQVNTSIKKQTEILIAFLKQEGFVDKEIICGAPQLHYHGEYRSEGFRYSIEMELFVHTPNVFLLYETVQKSQELIKMGVWLTYPKWDVPVKFIFTNLNEH